MFNDKYAVKMLPRCKLLPLTLNWMTEGAVFTHFGGLKALFAPATFCHHICVAAASFVSQTFSFRSVKTGVGSSVDFSSFYVKIKHTPVWGVDPTLDLTPTKKKKIKV